MNDPACATPAWSEADRLAALHAYGILDTGRESAFDDIAELAADLLDAPMAVVNFVAADRQWFKAEVGIGTDSLPLDVSICRHAILQPDTTVVPDLREDPRFHGNPLIHTEGGLRFYAGALLQTPEGLPLGTLCVLDREPRPAGVAGRQLRVLQNLAARVMAELELRRLLATSREQAKALAALAEAQHLVGAAAHDFDAALAAVVEGAVAAVSAADGATISFPQGDDMAHRAAAGISARHRGLRVPRAGSLAGLCFEEATALVVEDTATDPRVNAEACERVGARSLLAVPVCRHGHPVGVLQLHAHLPGAFTAEHAATARLFAGLLGTGFADEAEARAEEARRLADERAGLALEVAALGTWEVDLTTGAIHHTPEAAAIYGWGSGGAQPHLFDARRRTHPADRERVEAATAAALATGETYSVEHRIVRDDGTVAWVAARGRAFLNAAGRAVRAVGVTQDITARREAEARREFMLRFTDALHAAEPGAGPASRALAAAAGLVAEHFDAARAGFCEVTGDAPHESLVVLAEHNGGLPTVPGPVPLALFGEGLAADLRAGATVAVDDVATDSRTAPALSAHAASGSSSLLAVPLMRGGRLRAIVYLGVVRPRRWTASEEALARDIAARVLFNTERARAEEALAVSEAQFRATAEAMPGMLFVTAPDGGNTYVNHTFREYTGRSAEDLLGPRWLETLHPDDARRGALVWAEAVRSGEPYEAEYRFRRHDGAWRWHAVRGLPVRDESGAISRWVGTCIDIHERRMLEEDLHARVSAAVAEREEALARLHEAQKLETIGQLTGGVAHDFNNLLTPIVGSLDMLQRRGLPDDRSRRMVSGALQAAESARLLVQRLLAFARRQHLETRAVEVGALARGMQDLIERSIGPTVAVTVHAPEGLPPAQVDANQLELAILNLALNARDAMPAGGSLDLTVSEADHPAGLAPGRYVRLAVTDTGEGMDAETLKRCIEPFFTSKETGRGTGLGLSMVHGLAAQFGGALRLTSAPGEGTTAELWLPLATEPPGASAQPAPVASAGAARLLLVDDDHGVREATAEMLRDAGYAVQHADSAEAALAMLEGGLAVDALVTDHLMPGITGAQLVRRLRATRPEIAALVITGFSRADEIGDDFARLPKPFRQSELTAAIEHALGRAPEQALRRAP